ncbi:hypothetical protein L1D15_12260 [Vibrio sp. Isolate25]|uniref:hypothetical protein n=1 Tax=Vibrio sp. Isolate25 TaxID=2908535 RepID=UPI001EFD612E|nr:hypothetical protein [Vibrio sp. Isolate25]MCG9597490.1 hypothetical protein [Vibrio sp. Isolate25]
MNRLTISIERLFFLFCTYFINHSFQSLLFIREVNVNVVIYLFLLNAFTPQICVLFDISATEIILHPIRTAEEAID